MPEVLVVDASVAIKWVLPEPSRERAADLLRAYGEGHVYLIAPRLMRTEVASALSKRSRRGQISADEARDAFRIFDRRRPIELDTSMHLDQALSLSLRHQVSLWDCVYLALAIDFGCAIVTADQRFYRAVSVRYPFVELIA